MTASSRRKGAVPAREMLLSAWTAAAIVGQALAGNIRTVAGTGVEGFSGDGMVATIARLKFPEGLVHDGKGRLFIADQGNARVRMIDSRTGLIDTVAGAGRGGFGGDDGPAVSARLLGPSSLAWSDAGRLYILDTGNDRVRAIEFKTGTISTVAGNGGWGFNGDEIAATDASFANPAGICLDRSGNLYIADMWNHRVRRVDARSGRIATVAGTGQSKFNGDGIPAISANLKNPHGLAVDNAGNLLIADMWDHRVREIDGRTGFIRTLAGTGEEGFNGDGIPAADARLSSPHAVCRDRHGNTYIADKNNHRIRKIDAKTGLISTFAGTGEGGYNGDNIESTAAALRFPEGLALAAGGLYIADTGNHRVRIADF